MKHEARRIAIRSVAVGVSCSRSLLVIAIMVGAIADVGAQPITDDFDGFRSGVSIADAPQKWRDKGKNRFVEFFADLDGDGVDEYVILIVGYYDEPFLELGAVTMKDKRITTLANLDFNDLSKLGIRVVEPGEYVTACGKGQEVCSPGEPKALTLERPAICLFENGGAETIFYWDIETRSYIRVEMGS